MQEQTLHYLCTLGSASFIVTVNGANFTTSSQLQWNGTMLATTYISSSRLSATIPATDMTSATVASARGWR